MLMVTKRRRDSHSHEPSESSSKRKIVPKEIMSTQTTPKRKAENQPGSITTPSKRSKHSAVSTPATAKRQSGKQPSSSTTLPKASKAIATSDSEPPAIRSWVEARRTNSPVIIDPLPADKQQMLELLKEYLAQLDEQAGTLRYKTSRDRVAEQKVKTLSAIGSLYAPLDQVFWQLFQRYMSLGVPDVAESYVVTVHGHMGRLTSAWLEKPPLEEQRSGTGRPTETSQAQRTLHTWYRDICVLTGRTTGQSCHIIPSSAGRNPKRGFWGSLPIFWPAEEVVALDNHLTTREGQLQNLMMFSADMHIEWSKLRFAVKPIPSDDASQLDLEFHYLSSVSPGSLEHTQGSDTSNILDHRRMPARKLETGDIVHIKSQDPSEFLLPDARILTLQYHLQRALRASASGELLEILFRDDDPKPDASSTTVDVEEVDDLSYEEPPDPTFCDFLIDAAIDQDIVSRDAKEKWQNILYGGTNDDDEGWENNT